MARKFNDKPLGSIAWAYEYVPEQDIEDLVARSKAVYEYFESVAQLPQVTADDPSPSTGDLSILNSWFTAASADTEQKSTPDKPERTGWRRAAEQIGMVVLLSGAAFATADIVYKSVVFGPGYATPAPQPHLEIPSSNYYDRAPDNMVIGRLDAASITLPSIENSYKIA